MKELLKYAKFFSELTKGKLYLYVLISLFAVGCEGVCAMSLLPVLELGKEEPSKYASFAYDMLAGFGVSGNADVLLALLVIGTICFTLGSMGTVFAKIYVASLQTRILRNVELDLNRRLLDCRYEFYISKNIGFVNNAIIQQAAKAAFSFKHYATIIYSGFFAVLYFSIPFALDPVKVLVMGVLMTPMVVFLKLFNAKNRHYSMLNAQSYAKLNNFLIQMLSNFKYFKATARASVPLKRLEEHIRAVAFSICKLSIWGDTSTDVIRPYGIAVISGMVYYSVAYQESTLLEAGALFAFLYMAYQKGIVIPTAYQKFLGAVGPIEIYRKLLAELKENPDQYNRDVPGMPPDFSGSLKMSGVSFSYAAGKEEVIKNIDLEIRAKSTVAFVGESGSGKSTLVNLITALFKPQAGCMQLGGVDYSELDIYALRSGMGYVTQEPVIFNDTVANNISLWEEADVRDRVIAAAKKAHADSFIVEMPEKYDSLLGDSGVNLSGGQRQRLTIARELYRETPILIFDEATSALDSETEERIQREIDEFRGERTIILIAHRLATIKNADTIYVLDKGKVVESGSYEDLYQANGVFRTMADRQSLGKRNSLLD